MAVSKWGVIALVLGCIGGTAVRAEESAPKEPANYAFAAYMGSGLYGATDASLFVLNLPMTFQWRERKDIRIRFSTSAGFFDYGRENIEELEIPDSIGTLTLIPGVEKVYAASDRWELIPHIDYGYAKNFSTKEEAQVYSVGLHSRYYTKGEIDRHVWVNKIILAGYRTFSSDLQDNYVKLLSGFDYKSNLYITLNAGIAIPTLYGSVSWSYNGIDYVEKWKDRTARDLNYEMGISLYAPKPIDLWVTEVNRVGLGYQYNQFGNVIRLFAGTPF
ncbi:hypothetical protein [Ketobacter sp.]|uniref:hypothetical protein n=1 Tax=Ketobacter sp. TaxID=2083498 RepID=UPI000F2CC368|nr:hypothetical protein [Ketobacter sp.]RLU00387.1 MAG: hypothetical protein D9N14_07830 [Ketobacter sp.]